MKLCTDACLSSLQVSEDHPKRSCKCCGLPTSSSGLLQLQHLPQCVSGAAEAASIRQLFKLEKSHRNMLVLICVFCFTWFAFLILSCRCILSFSTDGAAWTRSYTSSSARHWRHSLARGWTLEADNEHCYTLIKCSSLAEFHMGRQGVPLYVGVHSLFIPCATSHILRQCPTFCSALVFKSQTTAAQTLF